MTNLILGILVVAALAVLFGWLATRAWHSKHALIKWLGIIVAGLLALVFSVATVIGAVGAYKLYAAQPVPLVAIEVQGTSEQIARGQHIAELVCVGCHTKDRNLPLSGGINLSDEFGVPLGDIYAPNLTPGGEIKNWTDAELFRMLRTGVNPAGRATAMTQIGSRFLSDADIMALIAYLRQSPAVANQMPPFKPSVLMALLTGAGQIKSAPPSMASVSAPPKAATAEYGEYEVNYLDCKGCHGTNLDGKVPPPQKLAPNLTKIVPAWTKDDFLTLFRTGMAPGGYPINNNRMPWQTFNRLDDVELEALYLYLHGLKPAAAGE